MITELALLRLLPGSGSAFVAAFASVAMTLYPIPEQGIFVVRPPGAHSPRKVRVLTEMLRSCARLKPLLSLGLGNKPACDDGDHCDPDVPGKEICGVAADDVEPPVPAEPGEQPLEVLPDAIRQEQPRPSGYGNAALP